MEAIKRKGTISPTVTPNWKFVPEHLTAKAIIRDRERLFHQQDTRQD